MPNSRGAVAVGWAARFGGSGRSRVESRKSGWLRECARRVLTDAIFYDAGRAGLGGLLGSHQ